MDLATFFGQDHLADEQRLDLREFAFSFIFKPIVEIFCHNEIKHGIAQKFQAFIGSHAAFLSDVNIRPVFECLFEQSSIGKGITEFALKLFLRTRSAAYGPASDRLQDGSESDKTAPSQFA